MIRSPLRSRLAAVAFGAALLAPGVTAGAQTFYPSFQPPRTVDREYNVAVADGDDITSLLFQWREGWSPVSQLSLDVGVADPEAEDADVQLLLGGFYARQLARSSTDMPLDLLLTLGANSIIGDAFALEVPVGVSVGHRFPLDGPLAITPYLHPRVALQYCSECGDDGDSDTDLGVAFDLGVDFEVSPRLSLRGTFLFGDDDADAIGFGLAWRPVGLRR
ncbi:MAG TPA: hypothetical protein VFS08_09760 [Gemmatimonadaceae bacterium]|nr:hypothetical protein [Gemmatimonadaceae bacterium]